MPVFRFFASGDPEKGMAPSSFIPKEAFTTRDTIESNHTVFRIDGLERDDFEISTGVLKLAPCRLEYEGYPNYEFTTLISGSITITDEEGHAQIFNPGDSFFISQGTPCTYEVTEKCKFFYMIAV